MGRHRCCGSIDRYEPCCGWVVCSFIVQKMVQKASVAKVYLYMLSRPCVSDGHHMQMLLRNIAV